MRDHRQHHQERSAYLSSRHEQLTVRSTGGPMSLIQEIYGPLSLPTQGLAGGWMLPFPEQPAQPEPIPCRAAPQTPYVTSGVNHTSPDIYRATDICIAACMACAA